MGEDDKPVTMGVDYSGSVGADIHAMTAKAIANAINKSLGELIAFPTKHGGISIGGHGWAGNRVGAEALVASQGRLNEHQSKAFLDMAMAPSMLVDGGMVSFSTPPRNLDAKQQVKAKTARKLRRMGCSTKPIGCARSERGTPRQRYHASLGDMLLLEVVTKTAIAIQPGGRARRGPHADLSWAYDAMKGHLRVADAVLRMGGTDALKPWMVEHLSEAMPRGNG